MWAIAIDGLIRRTAVFVVVSHVARYQIERKQFILWTCHLVYL